MSLHLFLEDWVRRMGFTFSANVCTAFCKRAFTWTKGYCQKLSAQLAQAYLYQTDQQQRQYSNSDSQSGEASASTKETTNSGLQRFVAVQKLFP